MSERKYTVVDGRHNYIPHPGMIGRYQKARSTARNLLSGGLAEPEDAITEHHRNNLKDGNYVKNKDGSVSTVMTAQVDIDGVPTLIPTVWDGRMLSIKDSVDRAMKSGKRWPTAKTHEELSLFDKKIHKRMGEESRGY